MQEALILIVDDLPNWQMALQRLLSGLGYSCETASSSQEAIDLLGKQTYELAIVDMRLSEVDVNNTGGMEIVNWLASTHSNTKVIVLTGHGTIALAVEALLSGVVVDFIEKTEIDRLMTSLTKAMQSL
jgi:ActR/RegA family two-component response regulator